MKAVLFVSSATLILASLSQTKAQTTLSADQLSLGTNQLENFQEAAIGSNNLIGDSAATVAVGNNNVMFTGYNSLAIGGGNYISNTDSVLVTGYGNNINSGDTVGATLVTGSFNSVGKWESLVGGHANTVPPDPNYVGNSFVFGSYNLSSASAAYDIVSGYNNVSNAWCSATIGQGLVNNWNFCTVIGRYNKSTATGALLLAVGSGTNSTNRSNAFEIYADGKVKVVKRQGDIRMGNFGLNGD